MHPLFSSFPLLSWRRMSARFTVSLLAPHGCFCVRNEPGNNAFYLYLLVSMTSIDFFLFFSFFSFVSTLSISQEYVRQNVSHVDNKPDYPCVEICHLEVLMQKKVAGIRWENRSRHRLGHVPDGVYTAWFVRGGQRALCWLHARSADYLADYQQDCNLVSKSKMTGWSNSFLWSKKNI